MESLWDDGANWLPEILHQIRSLVHVPMELSINIALDADQDTNLMGPFSSTDTNVEPLCFRKTIYLPATFVRLFLERYLTPMEAWTHLCDTILNVGLKVDCRSIIEWLCVALTLNTGDDKSPLTML